MVLGADGVQIIPSHTSPGIVLLCICSSMCSIPPGHPIHAKRARDFQTLLGRLGYATLVTSSNRQITNTTSLAGYPAYLPRIVTGTVSKTMDL